eukprot:TRINITY_DN473_c9_g1_i1.p1 TRINITY_DN473_c9_g1~~TRINITY_DN473_c9_g1_i1.p1  ORF type:complete len:813 (-),score=277.20 TRINITY_DN473_c9_g1_i1:78-2516(-)
MNVYLGKLPADLPDDILRRLFGFCGIITQWKRPADPLTGKLKQFCHCTFENELSLMRAMRLLNGVQLEKASSGMLVKAPKKVQEKLEEFENKHPAMMEKHIADDVHVKRQIDGLISTLDLDVGGLQNPTELFGVLVGGNTETEVKEQASNLIVSEIQRFRTHHKKADKHLTDLKIQRLKEKLRQKKKDEEYKAKREAREKAKLEKEQEEAEKKKNKEENNGKENCENNNGNGETDEVDEKKEIKEDNNNDNEKDEKIEKSDDKKKESESSSSSLRKSHHRDHHSRDRDRDRDSNRERGDSHREGSSWRRTDRERHSSRGDRSDRSDRSDRYRPRSTREPRDRNNMNSGSTSAPKTNDKASRMEEMWEIEERRRLARRKKEGGVTIDKRKLLGTISPAKDKHHKEEHKHHNDHNNDHKEKDEEDMDESATVQVQEQQKPEAPSATPSISQPSTTTKRRRKFVEDNQTTSTGNPPIAIHSEDEEPSFEPVFKRPKQEDDDVDDATLQRQPLPPTTSSLEQAQLIQIQVIQQQMRLQIAQKKQKQQEDELRAAEEERHNYEKELEQKQKAEAEAERRRALRGNSGPQSDGGWQITKAPGDEDEDEEHNTEATEHHHHHHHHHDKHEEKSHRHHRHRRHSHHKVSSSSSSTTTAAATKAPIAIVGTEDEVNTEGGLSHQHEKFVGLAAAIVADRKKEERASKPKPKLTERDARKIAKQIPAKTSDLFNFQVDWNSVKENNLIERKMKPWVSKKIAEYLGEEEPTMISFILEQLNENTKPKEVLKELKLVLDDDSEVFMSKLWRYLIFQSMAAAYHS